MEDIFRNIISVSDSTAIKTFSDKTLSISIYPGGLAYAVFDEAKYIYLALEELELQQKTSENITSETLESLFQTNSLLKHSFKKTHLTYFTPQLVLIPEKAYDPGQKENIFSLCAQLPESHQLLDDRLNILDAHGIYPIPKQLLSVIKQKFPDYRLRHHGSVLIESTLAAMDIESLHADIVLFVYKSYFEMLLFENQNLSLYQSFHYQAFDDLLYYLFYVLEKYNLSANEKSLLIMGKLALDTPQYITLSSFFKNVAFSERNDAFQYSKAFEKIPLHFYYTLLNLIACG